MPLLFALLSFVIDGSSLFVERRAVQNAADAAARVGLDAANKDLVMWQNGPGQDLAFNHNNSAVNGVIWVENGNLTYVGNSGATGFYEAQSVSITGNSYVMHGSGPAEGGSTVITGVSPSLDE